MIVTVLMMQLGAAARRKADGGTPNEALPCRQRVG